VVEVVDQRGLELELVERIRDLLDVQRSSLLRGLEQAFRLVCR
jgi:hypothetical protein